MKILAPVTSAEDVDLLFQAGAGEFYCGISPVSWIKRFGTKVWATGRRPDLSNLNDTEELKELVACAHKKGAPVFLTVNAAYYPADCVKDVFSMIETAVDDCKVDALIIGDPALIYAVRQRYPQIDIQVSSVAVTLNHQAVSFFQNLGVSRIILPRYIPIEDLAKITIRNPHIQYEVFILNDGCVQEEGHCYTSHLFGRFCARYYKLLTLVHPKDEEIAESFNHHLQDYSIWRWRVFNSGQNPETLGKPIGMCGICYLSELYKLGIASLKICGRGYSLDYRLACVRQINNVLDTVLKGEKPEYTQKIALQERDTAELCETNSLCYFR